MKTRIVKRHYCDHCKKSGFQIPAMIKHENGCTKNPNRVCRMCQIAGLEQKPTDELVACASEIDIYTGDGSALREMANGCPACILTALRLTSNYMADFDFKDECKNWMGEHGQDRTLKYAF